MTAALGVRSDALRQVVRTLATESVTGAAEWERLIIDVQRDMDLTEPEAIAFVQRWREKSGELAALVLRERVRMRPLVFPRSVDPWNNPGRYLSATFLGSRYTLAPCATGGYRAMKENT